eukprot:scaffold4267_cov115-Pinguiococcus_pyrenoidosus.AAC.1
MQQSRSFVEIDVGVHANASATTEMKLMYSSRSFAELPGPGKFKLLSSQTAAGSKIKQDAGNGIAWLTFST